MTAGWKREGRREMRRVPDGGHWVIRRKGEEGVSNSRGEMNGKRIMWRNRWKKKKWEDGVEKRWEMWRNARERMGDNEPYVWTPSALFPLSFFTHTHTRTGFSHLRSHTVSSPLFTLLFSPNTHLCTKNTPELIRAPAVAQKHGNANTNAHAQKRSRAQERTWAGEWAKKESLSLQQLPVHSYHYNNSEWH